MRLRDRIDPVLLCMVGAAFAAYAALSIIRHETYRSTGFDLALFEQVVRHYSRLEAPASALKGLDTIFSDHVSPVMALLGPWYALWPSAAALLVAQAALVAASAVPVFMYAQPRVGRPAALMLAGAYLLFGGIQEGIWFDVHELAFAPLLIGAAVVLADRGRWAWSFAAAIALLAVKEDMALVVVALGLWYFVRGRRALGAAAIVAGIGWLLLVTEVLVPGYSYWTYTELGPNFLESAGNVLSAPWRVIEVAVNDADKLKTTAYLFGAFLGLSLLSPLMLLALPLLAEKLLSTNPAYWSLESHYSLAIAVVLALAAADGLRRLRGWRPRVARFAAPAMLVLALALTAAFPLRELVRPSFYETPAAYRAASDALAFVPEGASVAATNRLAPHLDGRAGLTLLGASRSTSRYVVAALDDPSNEGRFPFATRAALLAAVAREGETRPLVFDRGGIVVLGPSTPP